MLSLLWVFLGAWVGVKLLRLIFRTADRIGRL